MKYERYTGNGTERRSAADIESDLADIRSEMSQTLHDLEERFSPRELIDQAFDSLRRGGEGGSDFLRDLGATIRDNPLPALLIGGGVAAYAVSNRRGRQAPDVVVGEEGGSKAGETKERARQIGQQAGERGQEMKERGREKAHEMKERGREKAHELKERGRGKAHELKERGQDMASSAGKRLSAGRERVSSGARRVGETINEQPLILLGLGLVAGALAAGTTPMSRRERQLMGEAREDMTEAARSRAREGTREGARIMEEGAETGPVRREEPLTEAEPLSPDRSLH